MLRFLLISIFVFSYGFVTAQTRWDNKNYKKISLSNFRDNPIFSQNIGKIIDYGLLNATLFYLSNEYRVKNRKSPLIYNTSLEITAWNHAKQMGLFSFFGHENPKDAKRKKLENRGELAGITNPFLAENLAYVSNEKSKTYLDICEKFILQWKSKKENLVQLQSDDALETGCGVFFFQNRWYAVQIFQSFETVNAKNAIDKLPE